MNYAVARGRIDANRSPAVAFAVHYFLEQIDLGSSTRDKPVLGLLSRAYVVHTVADMFHDELVEFDSRDISGGKSMLHQLLGPSAANRLDVLSAEYLG